MIAIAPNLTILVGELVGARLISHAGSLMNLAKHPASTVQILGAEKALFKALKTKHDTPKYGLIYHASLVGQASTKMKGKVSRMLAAKAALACRVDSLGEETNTDLGMEHRAKVEHRIKQLESGNLTRISGAKRTPKATERHVPKSDVMQYDNTADVTLPKKRGAAADDDDEKPVAKKIKVEDVVAEAQVEGEKKKKKKKDKDADCDTTVGADTTADMSAIDADTTGGEEKKKKKKKKKEKDEEEA